MAAIEPSSNPAKLAVRGVSNLPLTNRGLGASAENEPGDGYVY